jgi:hypothetical protein
VLLSDRGFAADVAAEPTVLGPSDESTTQPSGDVLFDDGSYVNVHRMKV